MKKNNPLERLGNGLFKENPTFVLALGMCPTLAVTSSAMNGLGMGLTTTAVLVMSNLIISLLRKVIPNRVRIPAFIVIVASFVTVIQLLLQAYLPSLNKSLGVYIPLIVVNCIILGRAESYAYHNGPVNSFFDGLGMGLGFSFALTIIGALRELLGTGKVFGYMVMPGSYTPILIFVLAPGAFFVLAFVTALMNAIKKQIAKHNLSVAKGSGATEEDIEATELPAGCTHDCSSCGEGGCNHKFYDNSVKPEKKAEKSNKDAVVSEENKKEEN